MKRIMYIEDKSKGLSGSARIGFIEYSNSMRSMKYNGRIFVKCVGFKYNCIDISDGSHWWITGPKKKGGDRLYSGGTVEIDDDAREEYWGKIRNAPERISNKVIKY